MTFPLRSLLTMGALNIVKHMGLQLQGHGLGTWGQQWQEQPAGPMTLSSSGPAAPGHQQRPSARMPSEETLWEQM